MNILRQFVARRLVLRASVNGSPGAIFSRPTVQGARIMKHSEAKSRFPLPLQLLPTAGFVLGISHLLMDPIDLDQPLDPSTQDKRHIATESFLLNGIESLVEPETSVAFPHSIQPPSCPPLVLVGLGVRKVSFLKIKVYVVGFYADPTLLQIPKDLSFEEKIDRIIHTSSCAIRIVPVRSTSYTHLRDAFIRALRLRITKSRQTGQILPDEDALEESLQTLKGIFPIKTLEKHSSLVIYSVPQAQLERRSLVLDGLGEIRSDWMAVNFFKTYFTGEGVSPALLKGVRTSLSPRG